jgi:hypothetical protein
MEEVVAGKLGYLVRYHKRTPKIAALKVITERAG